MALQGFTPSIGAMGIGAVFAAVVAGWAQVKNIFSRIAGILIITVEVQERCYEAVNTFCWQRLRRSPSSFRYYKGRIKFIRPLGRYGSVAFESLGDKGQLFWYGKKPLWVTLHAQQSDKAVLRFIRWTFDPDALLAEILRTQAVEYEFSCDPEVHGTRFRVNRMAGRSGKDLMGMGQVSAKTDAADTPSPQGSLSYRGVCVTDAAEGRLIGWGKHEIGDVLPQANPIDRLALAPAVEEAIAEVRRWRVSKEWYAERQIPWRRGLLLYGPPGTGKSSLTKALAQDLGLPIYLFDISTMDNQEFHRAWQTALADTPAIALIEDIDAVFHGRENVVAEKGQGLTYDCLLNVISGVESADGLLLVVTTNCLDKVDPALGVPSPGSTSSRPGRIDRAVELPILTAEGREKLAKRIMSGCNPAWVPYLVHKGEMDTGAQFEDRCATAALSMFWGDDPQAPPPTPIDCHQEALRIEEECLILQGEAL